MYRQPFVRRLAIVSPFRYEHVWNPLVWDMCLRVHSKLPFPQQRWYAISTLDSEQVLNSISIHLGSQFVALVPMTCVIEHVQLLDLRLWLYSQVQYPRHPAPNPDVFAPLVPFALNLKGPRGPLGHLGTVTLSVAL